MENTYNLIGNNFDRKTSSLPKGWEKRFNEKGQIFYVFKNNGRVVYTQVEKPENFDEEENEKEIILMNKDWEKNTNKILEDVIRHGGDKIKISKEEKEIFQDNLLHLRKLDSSLEEAGQILSIKKYLFNERIRGRITEKDILNFLRKKEWNKFTL
jgi:hypothetical protein